MRENTAAVARPRKPSLRRAEGTPGRDGVRVEGGVALHYLPSCDFYLRAETFVEAALRDLERMAAESSRPGRFGGRGRYRELEARRLRAAAELRDRRHHFAGSFAAE